MIHAHSHIPSGIWVLGFVSMLMDISSEMIHSVLPLFMVTTLGASTIAVGLVEGLAESLALVVKIFSGTLSDYLGLHMGMTQGLLAAMIAGASPADLRGTAYGSSTCPAGWLCSSLVRLRASSGNNSAHGSHSMWGQYVLLVRSH